VKHLCVKFGDSSCIGFLRYRAEKKTHKQTAAKTLPLQLRSARVLIEVYGFWMHWSLFFKMSKISLWLLHLQTKLLQN